jgi:hypothetical protein
MRKKKVVFLSSSFEKHRSAEARLMRFFLQYLTTIIIFGWISKTLLKINFSPFKPVLFSGIKFLFIAYTQPDNGILKAETFT